MCEIETTYERCEEAERLRAAVAAQAAIDADSDEYHAALDAFMKHYAGPEEQLEAQAVADAADDDETPPVVGAIEWPTLRTAIMRRYVGPWQETIRLGNVDFFCRRGSPPKYTMPYDEWDWDAIRKDLSSSSD
jgi:hypothetical protein